MPSGEYATELTGISWPRRFRSARLDECWKFPSADTNTASYNTSGVKLGALKHGVGSNGSEPVNGMNEQRLSACFERRMNRYMCEMKSRCSSKALHGRWTRLAKRVRVSHVKREVAYHPTLKLV